MLDDVSDFERLALVAFVAVSLAIAIGMGVLFELKDRRSPAGRLAPHRWFGV
jgi:hypothetical protein